MARRGRRRAGLMREDAARDAMRAYGFEEGVIKVCIKELLEEEQHVEDVRDHVGSSSTDLVGCGAETGTQTCQTDALSITSETEIMNSSPSTFPSGEVMDYASPVAFQSSDYAHHYAGGANSCGWISDEEDTDPHGDSVVVGDDGDDEMIHLTPEPLCEELKDLLREVRGEEKKRKRSTRWDT
ncbi:Nucleolar histone methyltransferase-related protein [Hirschfeldia incana]|nr:Nucleolar histone methyltransferase-related protein [Hirschfeldia incana]